MVLPTMRNSRIALAENVSIWTALIIMQYTNDTENEYFRKTGNPIFRMVGINPSTSSSRGMYRERMGFLSNPSNVHESACMPRVSEKMSTVRPMANDTDSRALMLSDTGSLMINRMKMYGTATLNMQIRLNTKAWSSTSTMYSNMYWISVFAIGVIVMLVCQLPTSRFRFCWYFSVLSLY